VRQVAQVGQAGVRTRAEPALATTFESSEGR
jgi:hypothetical protein